MATGEAEMKSTSFLMSLRRWKAFTICGLGDFAAWPIQGLFRHFRHEVEARITLYRTGRPHVQGARLGRRIAMPSVDSGSIAEQRAMPLLVNVAFAVVLRLGRSCRS